MILISLGLLSFAAQFSLALPSGGPLDLPVHALFGRATSAQAESVRAAAFKAADAAKKKPPKPQPVDEIFDGIPISRTLKFTPCLNVSLGDPPFYTNTYECSRLRVPVDYNDPNGVDTFVLGIVRIPAINPNAAQKGAFFLNQNFATNVNLTASGVGAFFQLSGLDGFDFYAWDFRGQGDTTPQIQCFTDQVAFNAYANKIRSGDYTFGSFNGTFPPTAANIKKNIQSVTALYDTFGQQCAQNYAKYLPYMSTADHARDLNNIITQLPNKPFINIYNYGYTTVLGATYAGLYPKGFDRMTMDGTVDSVKLWSKGDNDPVTVQDSTLALQAFFDSCAAAAPCEVSNVAGSDPNYPVGNCGGCYIWAATPAAVQKRFNKIISKYYYTPFKSSVKSPLCGDCETSYFEIYHGLFDGINLPQDGLQFAMLSSLRMREFELGRVIPGGAIEYFTKAFPPNLTVYAPDIVQRCVDQPTAVSGVPALTTYMQAMNASYNGLQIAANELWCSNWPAAGKAANPYTGFTPGRKITTKGQILFIANDLDPIYARANAVAMSNVFPNSGIVTLNEFGETTFFSGSSASCLGSYLGPFTASGTLPPAGAYCDDIVNGAFNVPYQKDYRH